MRRLHAAAVLALVVFPSLSAQQSPVTEVVNVTAIELSVDVRDRNGNVPHDLKPDDFVVLENGVERAVTAVEYERAPRLAGTVEGEAAPAVAPAEQVDRNVVIYVDLELSNHATMLDALRGLEKQAAHVISLGAVDIVITNPEVQWMARGITDAQTLVAELQKIEKLPAHDRLTEHRRSVLSEMQMRTPPGSPLKMKIYEARRAIGAEEEIVTRFHHRMTRVLSAVPRRSLNAMFLISDGFDLDPMEFYAEFVEEPEQIMHLRNAWAAKTGRLHDEFARSLASAGWTITSLSGGMIPDFRGAASESGSGKLSAFVQNLAGSAPNFMGHRRDALLAIADATGGRLASAPPEFADAIAAMGDRVRITYQVPRVPDAKPRKVEVRVRREGVKASTTRWVSSSTPEVTASARALEQLRGSGEGELPVAVRIQLDANADRRRRAAASLEVRMGLEPLGALRQQLTSATVRVTIAVESESAPSNVLHQTIDNYDLTKLQRILFTAPMNLDPDVRRIAVGMEELSSGMWGGTSVELPAAARGKTFASGNWDEAKTTLVAEDEPQESDGIAWMSWDDALTRAKAENKLIFIKIDFPAVCFGCDAPNPRVYRHPALRRHLEATYVPVRVGRNQAKKIGLTRYSGIADPWGRIRYQWEPKTAMELVSRLSNVAPYAGSLVEAGATQNTNPGSALAQFAIAYAYLQTDLEGATEAYTKARELAEKEGNEVLRERAETHLALVDARAERRDKAKEALERIIATAKIDVNIAEALLVLGHLRKLEGDAVGAADAFSKAAARAPKGSELQLAALAQTGKDFAPVVMGADGATRLLKPIQLIRPRGAVIAGRVQLQTLVRDARVDRVRFYLDDKLVETDAKPPFTATVELEATPRPHTFRIEADGRDRKLLGDDTLRVNERHDELVMKIVTPRGGTATGKTRVELDVQRPPQVALDRIDLYWNEAKLATLRQPPFVANVNFSGKAGYIRAVAVLDDGRTAEDVVTLNSAGYTEAIDVAVAELYARVVDGKGKPITTLTKDDFTVLDNGVPQEIVRAEYVDRPPLLIGVALDRSPSMNEEILDVHATAQDFLRNAFASDARAFVIGFDEAPQLIHETSNDLDALTQRIDGMRPMGRSTALFDALMFALLQFEGTSGKKALVIVSDGDDLSSRYTAREVADFARESGVTLYPIIFSPNVVILRPIAAMATRSGGKVFSVRSAGNLDAIYREIDEQLGGQYLIAIAPKGEGKSGEHRSVDVKVNVKGANVQATPGYQRK